MKEITISSTLIKDFLFNGEYQNEQGELYYCPMYIKKVRIDKVYETIPTEPMNKGLYFESLCIGNTADGNAITDLPRKTISEKLKRECRVKGLSEPIGEKTIDQIRIEEQAIVFKQIQKMYGMKDYEIQKTVTKKWDQHQNDYATITIKGVIDIYDTSFLDEGNFCPHANVDIKLTKNREGTFGNYCWGTPQYMDHIQAHIYSWITDMPFFYLVFDYCKDYGHKVVPVDIDSAKLNEMHEKIRKVCERIQYHDNTEWEAIPRYHKCKYCPVNHKNGGDCSVAENIQRV